MSARTRRAPLGALFLIILFAAAALPARGDDGTITFHGRTAVVGVGFTWGAATLDFQGQQYPVRLDGFVLGGLGTASLEAKGRVTGLTEAKDLNGDFTALAQGALLGSGQGSLVMRNAKGVRIEMDVTGSGLGLGMGPRGFTLEVGEAGGPPADESARLPQTLGFGELKLGPAFFRPTFNVQSYIVGAANPGFDGQWSFGPVDDAGFWFELSNEVGLNARYPLGEESAYGTLRGRVSGLFTMTASGPDGPVCNTRNTTKQYSLEAAYLAWQSGNLFPGLGFNAVEISGGNQNYQIFDGLLFWDGGQDCAGRGANWLSARKAFHETAIATLRLGDFLVEGVHLKYNDHPNSHTRLGAGRVEFAKENWLVPNFNVKLGAMYFHIYDSESVTRDDMDGIYLYGEMTPLVTLPDLTTKASFVRETNPSTSALSEAYAWYVAIAYELSQLPWTPKLGYRYASFSGGDDQAFDTLFTGLPDWGWWFQGELLGEYVLSDSNLNSHQVRLTFKPTERLTANVIYYKFLLDDKDQSFGLVPSRVDRNLADEVDLILDVAMTNWWSITTTVGIAVPNKGFRDAVDGSKTWVNGYVYVNFNF